jgi:hypothetical protein
MNLAGPMPRMELPTLPSIAKMLAAVKRLLVGAHDGHDAYMVGLLRIGLGQCAQLYEAEDREDLHDRTQQLVLEPEHWLWQAQFTQALVRLERVPSDEELAHAAETLTDEVPTGHRDRIRRVLEFEAVKVKSALRSAGDELEALSTRFMEQAASPADMFYASNVPPSIAMALMSGACGSAASLAYLQLVAKPEMAPPWVRLALLDIWEDGLMQQLRLMSIAAPEFVPESVIARTERDEFVALVVEELSGMKVLPAVMAGSMGIEAEVPGDDD